ncbi:ATP phosphoribosyltransferase [Paramaledivibacter caminithermalis]|uniref:ATP phosphoribosyltransferase n=1 Tax=Paramaledivibacter caminithermalis (strain DSM 15212 / CIP 107654 / DViRD3) TaxID=1121301 RepID=A0A1M6K971_PARC5|nr:ATP phosphoribosyltransferase [Paramaledivibacter caminithermalis]SHJ55511.1 ATP phosphoribosyltransferase [Paramaledivibacter caminithermalis DSM 15212]
MDAVKIALAKGRLADDAITLLGKIGINFNDYSKKSRKLIFKDDCEKIKLVFVKSSDIPVYVEKGAVDIGIVGKDVLLENEADVYEILNLNVGKCKICVAGFKNYERIHSRKLIIASKYPNIAKKYFNKKGIFNEVIKLNGSVELAPILGLSDVIVDIVETGTTLKENGLVVLEEIHDISARLVVNKVSLKTKNEEIEKIISGLERIV